MTSGPHPYQEISLSSAGTVLGIFLVVLYGLMLWKPEAAKKWAVKLPRHHQAGIYSMSIGMIWFWLLVAPQVRGTFSFLGALSMDFADFSAMKPYLQIAVPLACVGMIYCVREFLFVRGLGLCLLMAAAPLLYAGDFEVAPFRVIIAIVAYAMIIKGLYFVGMPYLFRDGASWLVASDSRFKMASLGGLVLGLVILGFSFTLWRGY
ncbi:hypothetical protein N8513_01795 [bacterium]|nr:hypothetical protein [bacterium]MDA7517604.1 hypothetical protein [Akkermansiaceae bacterium]MDA7519138.1 hypothetical protein [Akkermansiaceae bacterium]MDA7519755.1 hypothetical protein [bacterium]MDA7535833.1 hypothetical protein [Akkermansiaceae bacterium]